MSYYSGMQRLFIGVPASDEVRQGAAALARKLWRPDVKWVEPENFHVTLRFLGSVEDADVAGWLDKMKAAARRAPFEIAFGAVESRKSVIWVNVEDPGGLAAMAAALGEEPGFRPHLTLGRPKGKVRVEGAALGLKQTVDRIVLFRSVTAPAGPVYTALESFVLRLPQA